jgi:hypothetical protein
MNQQAAPSAKWMVRIIDLSGPARSLGRPQCFLCAGFSTEMTSGGLAFGCFGFRTSLLDFF